MPNLSIQVESLSKAYRIGSREERSDTLASAAIKLLRAPLSNLKRLQRLSTFRDDDPDTLWALKDVSFELKEGEVVGVIGRNGAGKSTLLKLLSRITYPTSGKIHLRGRVASLLEVGTGFHPELTGRENVYLNGTILGMTRAEIDRKFDEIVAFSGVSEYIDTPVKRFSSGMQVRLAFSVAAHLEPEILLVDEVLAVGDLDFQRKSLGQLDKVSEGGRTVIFVSHQMNQIRRLCQRVIWIDGGQIRADGETHEVIGQYENFIQNLDASNESNKESSVYKWEILGQDGLKLDHKGPVTIRFYFRTSVSLRSIRIGLFLYDKLNRLVWSSRSERMDLDIGEYILDYQLSGLPLQPGIYTWNVWYDRYALALGSDLPYLSITCASLTHPSSKFDSVLNPDYSLDLKPVD